MLDITVQDEEMKSTMYVVPFVHIHQDECE